MVDWEELKRNVSSQSSRKMVLKRVECILQMFLISARRLIYDRGFETLGPKSKKLAT